MTPKEKAEQLVNEHYSLISGLSINFISKLIALPNGVSYYEIAKKCSLVAVDEILNFDIKAKNESQFIIERRIEDYWQEVKQEIERI